MYVVLLYQYSFIEIFLSFSNHASNVQRCDYLPLQKVVELQHTMMKQSGQECLQCSGDTCCSAAVTRVSAALSKLGR